MLTVVRWNRWIVKDSYCVLRFCINRMPTGIPNVIGGIMNLVGMFLGGGLADY